MKRIRMVLWCAALAAACENAGSDRVISVGFEGLVTGTVVFDANGNGAVDASDTTIAGATVRIVRRGSGAEVASAVTTAAGTYRFEDVPVGEYRFDIDSMSVGDTVVVASISVDTFTVAPGDTISTTVRVRYPFATVAEVRAAPVGRRLFLHGTALTPLGIFGDTTVHVVDSSGTLRVVRVRPSSIAIGDSLRLLGRRNVRNGQPTLDDVTVFPLSVGIIPTAQVITTAQAAGASGGSLDAVLVSVLGATVTDTATVSGDYHVTSDDGSGALVVVVSPLVGINTAAILPDSILDVTGVLVPDGTGTWQLKPRVTTDVTIR